MLEQASVIRQKRRTIKITITDSGDLVVYTPYGIKYDKIEEILQSKRALLNKKIAKVKAISNKYSKIISHQSLMLFGKEYLVVPTDKVKKACFTDEYFLVPQKQFDSGKTDYLIKKGLKEIAQRVLLRRINDILSYLKTYKPSRIVLGSFKSKWGSCDNFGVIKLNWRLVMIPQKHVDFVIYHELTHLKELNHSKKFYENLSKICPTWKESREDLKNYTFCLSLYN